MKQKKQIMLYPSLFATTEELEYYIFCLLNCMEGWESAARSYITQRHTEMQANEGCENCNCFLI